MLNFSRRLLFHMKTRVCLKYFAPNFSLNLQFWFFTRNLTKAVSPVENEKALYTTIEFWIFEFVLVLTKFQLKLAVLIFLSQIYPTIVVSSRKQKSEHHHWILHFQIVLVIKFQLNMTFLTFCTKFARKGYFRVQINTYYIKLFRTGADKHNGILMSLLLLVAETIIKDCDNVVFIATSVRKVMPTKKWDVNDCKTKVSKSLLKVRNFVELFFIGTWQMHLWTNIFQLRLGMLFL